MGIHDGHRQRLRDKYANAGLERFEDHEVLELLLFYSIPYRDTNEIAHNLINHFGSIGGVFSASVNELTKVKGITQNSAVLISMIPKIMVRVKIKGASDIALDSVPTLTAYCKSLFLGEVVESLKVICLDQRLKVLGCETISGGTTGTIEFSARKIIETAFKYKSDIIALAHNHPRGETSPSQADIAATNSLKTTLSAVGIKLLDHIIVADGDALSMKGEGILFDL